MEPIGGISEGGSCEAYYLEIHHTNGSLVCMFSLIEHLHGVTLLIRNLVVVWFIHKHRSRPRILFSSSRIQGHSHCPCHSFPSFYSSAKILAASILSWIYFEDLNSITDKWLLNINKLPVQLNTITKTALILFIWTDGILIRTPPYSLNLPILVPSRIKTPRLLLLNLLILLLLSPPRITIIHPSYQTQQVSNFLHMLRSSSKGLRNLVSGVICVFRHFQGAVTLSIKSSLILGSYERNWLTILQ